MNESAYEYAGLILSRDNALVITRFRAPMSEANHFAGYSIRPFEVFGEVSGECSDLSRRVRRRRA
jgi:hypothetical protein